MKITFLGTGTSQGVPVINCECPVCLSEDAHDQRLRSSILVESNNTNVVIDVGPDFRQQMLRKKVNGLDAVVLTHEHNDHIIGMDDLRPFNYFQKRNMEIYGTQRVLKAVQDRFEYAFIENPYPGAPRFQLIAIHKKEKFEIGNIEFLPLEVMHGSMEVMAFRIENFAYVTDAKIIPSDTLNSLQDLDVLVINALHHRTHHSHFNLAQAIEIISALKPKQAYLTHISHWMGKSKDISPTLPSNIALAYDQLCIELI